jgi:hypothetical protein
MNPRVLIGSVAIVLAIVAGAIAFRSGRPPAATPPRPNPQGPVASRSPRNATARPASVEMPPAVELLPRKITPKAATTSEPAPDATAAAQPVERGLLGPITDKPATAADADFPDDDEPVVPVPLARAALGFVGADPDAEAVWLLAINDPALTPDERKDLIEDLNEDGFPDPKNLTIDDLPLILSRIELIEEVGPNAMDETNAAAFAEAYKDLINMLARITQQ